MVDWDDKNWQNFKLKNVPYKNFWIPNEYNWEKVYNDFYLLMHDEGNL
jgi:hypothetical protein